MLAFARVFIYNLLIMKQHDPLYFNDNICLNSTRDFN